MRTKMAGADSLDSRVRRIATINYRSVPRRRSEALMPLWPDWLDRRKLSTWSSSRRTVSLQVELDDPHREYSPGMPVNGQAVLVLAVPTEVSAINIDFKAFVAVRPQSVTNKLSSETLFDDNVTLWQPSRSKDHPGDPTVSCDRSHSRQRPSSTPTILASDFVSIEASQTQDTPGDHSHGSSGSDFGLGSGRASGSNSVSNLEGPSVSLSSMAVTESSKPALKRLFRPASAGETHTMTSHHQSALLPAGEHRFHFELELAKKGLLSSIEFERGSISYLITAILERPNRKPRESLPRTITVVCPLDVAHLRPVKPVNLVVHLGRRSKNQKATVSLNTGKRGFLKGENIPVKLAIQHAFNVQASSAVIITLARITRLNGSKDISMTFRKDLAQQLLPLYTDPKSLRAVVDANLRVPAEAFPTIKNKLVSFQYMVEIVVDLTGSLDFAKWANPDPHVAFIDTDCVKYRSGVISAWCEILLGTHRSQTSSPSSSVHIKPSSKPLSMRTATSSHSQTQSHVSIDQSSFSDIGPSAPAWDAGQASSPSSVPVPGTVTTADTALFGSPNESSNPTYHLCHILPPNSSLQAAQATSPEPESSNLTKQQLAEREAALYPSAPEYQESSVSTSAPVPAGTVTVSEPPQTPHSSRDDKRELEYARLTALATAPADGNDNDFVPMYEPSQHNSGTLISSISERTASK